MAERFIDDDAFNQDSIFQFSSNFTVDFDQFKIDVFASHVGYGQNGVDCDFS